jgi:protein-tyrosine phosphatase
MITFDFHSHILPGADHGASDRAESGRILRAAKQAGIETIAATPHFYPHRHHVSGFLERREAAKNRIAEICATEDVPNVLLGAEVLACPGIDNMPGLDQLTLENTNILLLEMPFIVAELTEELFETVERLIDEQHFVIFMAHANRYPDFCVDRMVSMGAKLQLNLEDICSFRESRRAKRWIKEGLVYAVGSDVHHDEKIYKKLKKSSKIVMSALERINDPLHS